MCNRFLSTEYSSSVFAEAGNVQFSFLSSHLRVSVYEKTFITVASNERKGVFISPATRQFVALYVEANIK